MQRERWGSKLGFILATAGSAIGLANIWRFPYIVGEHGGAAFILLYLFCLAVIGFPTFISEITIGRTAQKNPSLAFEELGQSKAWGWAGKLTVLTGFIVSAFYSAVAGWILGYLVEAVRGNLTLFESTEQAAMHYQTLVSLPWWGLLFHFLFIGSSVAVLYLGVKEGIEKWSKFFLPMLFMILILLVIRGLTLSNSGAALKFLFEPDWSALTPAAFIIALGQSFFTLSIGQGTLVTYGSYMDKKANLVSSTIPVVLMDTIVSILAAVAIFTIAFSVGMQPDSGPSLIFQTLPMAFSQLTGGYTLAVLFFLLVFIAALTSEISALEPSIAYLIEERGWARHKATLVVGAASFAIGIPAALSTSLLSECRFLGCPTFLDGIMWLASDVMIPIGGLLAVILLGWRYGISKTLSQLSLGASKLFDSNPWIKTYFKYGIKFIAPILILLVLLFS